MCIYMSETNMASDHQPQNVGAEEREIFVFVNSAAAVSFIMVLKDKGTWESKGEYLLPTR